MLPLVVVEGVGYLLSHAVKQGMGINNDVVIMVGLNKGIRHLTNKSKRVVRTMTIGQEKNTYRNRYGSEGKGTMSEVNASVKSRDLGQIRGSSREIETNVRPEKVPIKGQWTR